MKPFRHADLASLRASETAPCISIYMPTMRHHPESDQNPIRFRNLLRRAEEQLGALASSPAMRAMWKELEALDRIDIWRAPGAGLAILATAGSVRYYRVPLAVPERVVVADSFHVKPLLRLLAANRRYAVLQLSLHKVLLFLGTETTLLPFPASGLPESAALVLGELREPASGNIHTVNAADSGSVVHHGQSEPGEFQKSEALRFFRVVDGAVQARLHDDPVPLILATTAANAAIYREANHNPHLHATTAEGNFDHTPYAELHTRAAAIAAGHFREREDAWLLEYGRALSLGKATSELSTVGRAMVEGSIRLLFLADGSDLKGSIDRTTGEVKLHGEGETGYDDVLDDLAEGVLDRKGEVVLLDPARMPAGQPAAAILRW